MISLCLLFTALLVKQVGLTAWGTELKVLYNNWLQVLSHFVLSFLLFSAINCPFSLVVRSTDLHLCRVHSSLAAAVNAAVLVDLGQSSLLSLPLNCDRTVNNDYYSTAPQLIWERCHFSFTLDWFLWSTVMFWTSGTLMCCGCDVALHSLLEIGRFPRKLSVLQGKAFREAPSVNWSCPAWFLFTMLIICKVGSCCQLSSQCTLCRSARKTEQQVL